MATTTARFVGPQEENKMKYEVSYVMPNGTKFVYGKGEKKMENKTYKQVVGAIKATPKATPTPVTFETIVDILSNGLAQECGFDGVDYESGDYGKAKQALLDSGFNDPCLEDVQAQMLVMGLPLCLHMAEERPDEEWYNLTLGKLIRGIEKYDASEDWNGRAWDVCNGDPECKLDFLDYDAILQFAVYGKRIIG